MGNKEVIAKLKGLQQLLEIANEYDSVPELEEYDVGLYGEVLLKNYSDYLGYSPSDINTEIRIATDALEEEDLPDLVSFAELEYTLEEDLAARLAKHSSQSGSIFRPKALAMKALRVAEGHVKYIKGKLDYDTRCLGYIPKPDGGQLKITEVAIKSYVDQHKLTVAAIEEEAKAIQHLDDCRALATTYNDVTNQLVLLQSLRKNEFYGGDTTVKAKDTKAEDGVPGLK